MNLPKEPEETPVEPSPIQTKINQIEQLIGKEVGRNTQRLVEASRGSLYRFAQDLANHPSPSVMIVTGFWILRAQPPAPETDGPVGAAHMAAALANVGIPVEVVTDVLCQEVMEAALKAVNPHIPVTALPISEEAVQAFPPIQPQAISPLSHLIAIERVGPSISGPPCNAMGMDLSQYTAPLHEWFMPPRDQRPYFTLGIGDGGNEIGMGKFPSTWIAEDVRNGERLACTVSCDETVVCGVSNWGGPALVGALALLREGWKDALLRQLTTEMDHHILEAVVNQGKAVDSSLVQCVMSVDGLPWEAHAAMLEEILRIVKE